MPCRLGLASRDTAYVGRGPRSIPFDRFNVCFRRLYVILRAVADVRLALSGVAVGEVLQLTPFVLIGPLVGADELNACWRAGVLLGARCCLLASEVGERRWAPSELLSWLSGGVLLADLRVGGKACFSLG